MLFKKLKRVPHHIQTVKSQLFQSKIPLLLRTTSALTIVSGTVSSIITAQLLIGGLFGLSSLREVSEYAETSNAFAELLEMFLWLAYPLFTVILGLLVAILFFISLGCFAAAIDLLNFKQSGIPKAFFSQLAILSASIVYIDPDPAELFSLSSIQQPANILQAAYDSVLFYHYRISPWVIIVSIIACLSRPNIRRALRSPKN